MIGMCNVLRARTSWSRWAAGCRVPATMWLPEGVPGVSPVVLLGHGGGGHRRAARHERFAERLNAAGIGCLAIDRPFHVPTRIELANALFEYLEVWHNRKRRHSQLGWQTPIGFERNRIITVARESKTTRLHGSRDGPQSRTRRGDSVRLRPSRW